MKIIEEKSQTCSPGTSTVLVTYATIVQAVGLPTLQRCDMKSTEN